MTNDDLADRLAFLRMLLRDGREPEAFYQLQRIFALGFDEGVREYHKRLLEVASGVRQVLDQKTESGVAKD